MTFLSVPANIRNEVRADNREIFKVVGRHITYHKQLQGLSDRIVAQRAGCSASSIYKLRKGGYYYSGITFLTKVARALNCNLLDWLRSEPPQAV